MGEREEKVGERIGEEISESRRGRGDGRRDETTVLREEMS